MRQGSMDVAMALATMLLVLLVRPSLNRLRGPSPAWFDGFDRASGAAETIKTGTWFALGACVPLGATISHGLWSSAHGWWFAMVAYRGSTDSIFKGPYGQRFGALVESLPSAAASLGVVVVLAGLGLRSMRRGLPRMFVYAWFAWSTLGFSLGGLFWGHYYVQLLPVICVLAGVGADTFNAHAGPSLRRKLRSAATPVSIAILCLPLLAAVPRLADPGRGYHGDPRIDSVAAAGRAVAEYSEPSDRVFALWEAPGLYGEADRLPATRYLWWRGLEQIPGATLELVDKLEGDATLTVVAQFQPFEGFEGGSRVEAAIQSNFCMVRRVQHVYIWTRRTPGSPCQAA